MTPASPSDIRTARAGSVLARLSRAGVRYRGSNRWIPQGVSLDIRAGTSTLVMGPSGCGKSTITLTLNGLVPHSVPSDYRGSVVVAGQEVADSDVEHLAGAVAMVMQDPDSQIVTTKVLDEVCYALENLLVPAERIEARAMAALRAVGMAEHAESNPWQLSGGQRQRVVLASALAVEPALLILDEPTANLDPAASAGFYALVPALTRRGVAVVVVEHELDEIIGAIDRVVALNAAGDTIAIGSPEEVFGRHGRTLAAAGIRLPTAVRLHRLPSAGGGDSGDDQPGGRDEGTDQIPLTLEEAARDLARRTSPDGARGVGGRAARHGPGDERAGRAALSPGPGKEGDSRAPAALEVHGLCVPRGRRRRRRPVLHEIELTVRRGELVAVVGVNGSGKTTLLRALAGLEPWTSGRVAVAGRPRRPGRPGRAVTLVMQNPEHQFLERTVRDELAHGMRLSGAGHDHIDRVVARTLERFDLAEHAESNPFLLSGGQQRRLSVASVLGEERALVCLDEPTFGQDHHGADALMGHLHDLTAQGTGVIFSTHDMELAAEHADRVLVLVRGRAVTCAPADQVMGDADLLERAGLHPPPLARLTAAAKALGGTWPVSTSWKELM